MKNTMADKPNASDGYIEEILLKDIDKLKLEIMFLEIQKRDLVCECERLSHLAKSWNEAAELFLKSADRFRIALIKTCDSDLSRNANNMISIQTKPERNDDDFYF